MCCRAGELSAKELEELMVIVSNPRTFKIPDWFLNRQKDHKDGRFSQLTSSALDTKLREDLERLKKIRYVLRRSLFSSRCHCLMFVKARSCQAANSTISRLLLPVHSQESCCNVVEGVLLVLKLCSTARKHLRPCPVAADH